MVVHNLAESGPEGIHGGIAGDPGCVGQDLLSPDEARFLAQVDDVLEEPAEDGKTEALADASKASGVRQRLVEAVAEVPPDAEPILRQRQELALRADSLEEHHQVELEEDDGIDGRPASVGAGVPDPIPDEAEVLRRLAAPVEVIVGNEAVEGNHGGCVEVTGSGGAEQRRSPKPQEGWPGGQTTAARRTIITNSSRFARRWAISETRVPVVGSE
jgi:hypothetical protein